MIHLGSVINFEHRMMVRAIGGLLAFIHSNRDSVLSMEGCVAAVELRVHSVSTFTLTDFMHIDAVTFSALQIFQVDSHPSAVKTGRSKEGFSLYSLLDRTRSITGRRILKQVHVRMLCESGGWRQGTQRQKANRNVHLSVTASCISFPTHHSGC